MTLCRFGSSGNSSQAAGSDGEDDEHDDYGFNRRPSVRGIRPRFGTTQEIVNQVLDGHGQDYTVYYTLPLMQMTHINTKT